MKRKLDPIRNCSRKNGLSTIIAPLKARTVPSIVLLALALSVSRSCASYPRKWEDRVSRIVWVAYSPPTANPNKGIEPTPAAIVEDLAALRKARFTGLVTYGSSGVLGRELPRLAESQGFEGLIIGIWDPSNKDEIAAAESAAKNPIVLGICVGNEGLGLGHRYQFNQLSAAIDAIRKETGKPVTTTETIDQYSDDRLLRLGDWVFPNAHPFFHSQIDPEAAVRWTKAAYDDIARRSHRFVLFKEVGLPTAGDAKKQLSETAQDQYYTGLATSGVRFVYFEAFDQPWKTTLPIEPHWGIFRADRTPKKLALSLMRTESLTGTAAQTPKKEEPPSGMPAERPFYVYQDIDSPNNHFKPTGYMGDIGDIHIDEAFERTPHSGKTCIRVVYDAKGKAPNECGYAPPCRWAGVYWQDPPNNWGKEAFWKGKGFDLSRYNRLVFWAKADRECAIEFKVGGINQAYGDSLPYPRTTRAELRTDWQEFKIDLADADLTHIIGGFCFATNWDTNPSGATFYLDDIRFERKQL